jgi:hypothetical protein
MDMNSFEKEEQIILQALLEKQGNLFRHLQRLVEEILKDGEINSKDIPNLILFVKDLYAFMCTVKEELDLEIHYIQDILPTLVKKIIKYFAIDWNEEQMLILGNVIDASIHLLFYTTEVIGTRKCFRFCF